MQEETIAAIYENGTFRPLDPVDGSISEGQRVDIVVRPVANDTPTPDEILALAAKVYEGLSEEEINEIEKIALERSNWSTGRPSV
ncbi:MAG: antitoxin family protein [Chloroflexota bacterium]|nr:antitoxin family protein [Chloroflexota bacterium]